MSKVRGTGVDKTLLGVRTHPVAQIHILHWRGYFSIFQHWGGCPTIQVNGVLKTLNLKTLTFFFFVPMPSLYL